MSGTGGTNLVARKTGDTIQVRRESSRHVLLVQNARANCRPFLHPILAPDESSVLTEDAPAHHPWQHGLCVGLNDINGVGFWTEGLLAEHQPMDGTFHPRPLSEPVARANTARWAVATEYRSPQGESMMDETQHWCARDDGPTYGLDLDWSMGARIDLRFGRYDYGGLFVRMPWRAEAGFTIRNSNGDHAQTTVEAQRARWVAVSTGRAGLAIYDHPDNPEYPTPWRADNSFGFGPSRCIAGAWTLAAGASVRFRHRLFVFNGPIDPGLIEEYGREWE